MPLFVNWVIYVFVDGLGLESLMTGALLSMRNGYVNSCPLGRNLLPCITLDLISMATDFWQFRHSNSQEFCALDFELKDRFPDASSSLPAST